MYLEILPEAETAVQFKSEGIIDSYEDLITELHRFLDRLVEESAAEADRNIFLDGGQDE